MDCVCHWPLLRERISFFDQTFFLKESLLHDLSHHYRAFSVLIIEGNVPDLHKSHTPV